jgi:glycosyltransferase involved in cell wall biosynthesis
MRIATLSKHMLTQNNLKIGYVPLNDDLISAPGDYRRFPEYAKIKEVKFELAREDKIYDLVVVSQGADITFWSRYPHGVIVYDFIDSYLSIPQTNLKGLLRGTIKFLVGKHKRLEFNYWKTVRKMCSRSDAVICSTNAQQKLILPFCKNTRIILDIQDSVVKNVKEIYKAQDTFKIVWEGLACNLYQLKFVSKALQKLSKGYKVELHIITDSLTPSFLGSYFPISTEKKLKKIFHSAIFHKWNKETLAKIICDCDLAIIPVDTKYPLTSGKPENKLLLLWRMGTPVVTSNTFAYKEAMEESGFDLTCDNEDDWFNKIESLINSEDLRLKAATYGMSYVNKHSNVDDLVSKWDNAFNSLGFDFSEKSK